jgi:hypothetical protein
MKVEIRKTENRARLALCRIIMNKIFCAKYSRIKMLTIDFWCSIYWCLMYDCNSRKFWLMQLFSFVL